MDMDLNLDLDLDLGLGLVSELIFEYTCNRKYIRRTFTILFSCPTNGAVHVSQAL